MKTDPCGSGPEILVFVKCWNAAEHHLIGADNGRYSLEDR
jgi:hypothetical protein